MARPVRNDVDYFPFLCKEGKGMHYIETKYGNDGYATWMKILRQLAVTNFHYLDLSIEADLMFLCSKCKISEEKLIAIINDLCRLGEVETELWTEYTVVFSEKFVINISDAYRKRENNCIDKDSLLRLLLSKRRPKQSNCIPTPAESSVNGVNNPHTILDNSIVKESESNYAHEEKTDLSKSNLFRQPTIPLLETVKQVFARNGGTDEMAISFFNKNEGTGWFIRGSPIVNFGNLVHSFIENWNIIESKRKNNAESRQSASGIKTSKNAGALQLLESLRQDIEPSAK